MPWLAALAAPFANLSGWWKAALGAVLMFAPAFMLGQCSGKHIEKTAQEARQARADAKASEQAREADQRSAARKTASDATIAANRKELDNATAGIPDQSPSARQRARVCAELRRSGQVDAAAACGPVQPGH